MPAPETSQRIAWYRVPVVWLLIVLPALAIVGSGIVLAITQLRPDAEVHSDRLP